MRIPLLLVCALSAPAVEAASCSAQSGPTRAQLVELYTSEGCSSCPPADRWLSALPASPTLVRLAYHVDYWDSLGWRDPFGQAAFSERQRMRNRSLGWVYTPQVMLDGEDKRAWSRGLPAPTPPARVRLTLALEHTSRGIDARVATHFAAKADQRGTKLYLALYENKLESRITAGENAARTLRHDFVVRELAGPFDPDDARHRFSLRPDWQPGRLGVAAFAIDKSGATLQALARPGCPS